MGVNPRCPRRISGVLVAAVAHAALAPTLAATPPGKVLDLSSWKLTLPYNTKHQSGNPDEVTQPELATFSDPENFRTSDSGDYVLFRAACDGKGTENSKYPRSELREMSPTGRTEAEWATDDGGAHAIEVEIAVTQTPRTKEHVVCLQIHDHEDDLLMVRLEDDLLFIERDGEPDVVLDSEYRLGKRFKIRVIAKAGRVKTWHNGVLAMDWPVKARRCYFKVGCYTQSNRSREKRPGSYGEVAVYRLGLSHSGSTE